MSTRQDQQDQQVSGWATGGLVFASVMLALAGFFQIIAGIAAISNDEAKETYPEGWEEPKPYIRIVPQPH